MTRTNDHGQPVGEPVPGWTPRQPPTPRLLEGRHCTLVALADADRSPLYDAVVVGAPPQLWTYMSGGPFSDRAAFDDYLDGLAGQTHVMVVLAPTEQGIACYWNTSTVHGSTEVGSVTWAPALQRTAAATEAVALMMRHAFDDLGYRRFEWKCDSLNEPSRQAALRLGFTYEGRFRNAVVYKGRTRDTDWFSITDAEWPRVRAALDAWLDPANFDDRGRQLAPLRARAGGVVSTP
ncbi:MAG TPA: GNAT family protein [Marmoricola sp.]|nr:GNAT family protein [Marmoricola sp.]